MQPRRMPARPPTPRESKSPPPAVAATAPSWTPKAAAEASASEPTASRPARKKRKKRAEPPQPVPPPRAPPVRSPPEAGESAAPPLAMVLDAGAAAARAYRGKCLYQSRKCENERALKRNGLPHNLCEEHRSKQNQHQRKFDAKKFSRKRRGGSDGEPDADATATAAAGADADADASADSEPAARDKKRLRAATPTKPRQTQRQTQAAPGPAHASPAAAAPPLANLPLPSASALYAGAAAPTTPLTSMSISASMAASPVLHLHVGASSRPAPGVSPLGYPLQATPARLPHPQHLDVLTGRPAAGYSLSEIEAARILVPTSTTGMATTGMPTAGMPTAGMPTAYHQAYAYQQQYFHPPPAMRRVASMPDPARANPALLPRAQADARVLPPLLRPPPTAFGGLSVPRPHSFPRALATSAAAPPPMRSPPMSAAGPLPLVPRLASLGPAPTPTQTALALTPPSAPSEALPSLAPLRTRRSPSEPAASQ